MPGIAADQQHRAAHEAAAGDAVEFGNAGREPWRILILAGQRLKLRNARPLRPPRPDTGTWASAFSSMIVLHSPQASHLPCQRPYTVPQFWQTKQGAFFAIQVIQTRW